MNASSVYHYVTSVVVSQTEESEIQSISNEGNFTTFKIFFCLFVFLSSFIFHLIPLFKKMSKKQLPIVNCFSAGVLIALAIVQILPKTMEKSSLLMIYGTNEIICLIILLAIILFIYLEKILIKNLMKIIEKQTIRVVNVFGDTHNNNDDEEEQQNIENENDDDDKEKQNNFLSSSIINDSYVYFWTKILHILCLGIIASSQSIIIGLILGLCTSKHMIEIILCAIIMYKPVECLSISTMIIKKEKTITTKQFVIISLFFSIIIPFGVILGMIILETLHETNLTQWIVLFVNSFSIGLFIYISLVRVIARESERKQDIRSLGERSSNDITNNNSHIRSSSSNGRNGISRGFYNAFCFVLSCKGNFSVNLISFASGSFLMCFLSFLFDEKMLIQEF